jgi:hypothetical protein
MADEVKPEDKRFIIEWEQDNMPDMNVKDIADGEAEAVSDVRRLLTGEKWFDEEKQEADKENEGYYEDFLIDAVEAFERDREQTVEQFVAAMRVGHDFEFRVEDGTFKITRNR